MKTLLLIVGVLVLIAGLFWAGQGAGIVPWPATSFMVNNSHWIWYGGATALAGAILIWWSRR
jgi:hypothetical protein